MGKIEIGSQFSKILIILLLTFFVVGKTISVAHSFEHGLKHSFSGDLNNENCEICNFANAQSQLSITPNFKVILESFLLLILARKFDSIKLSYLLTSRSSRAPPVIS
jgi:hypothetical protein